MIVDFHAHIFPSEMIRAREEYRRRDGWFGMLYENPCARMATAEELVASMDQAGVDATVAFGFAWRDHGLCKYHNDYVLDARRRFPGRIIGFATVNPSTGDTALLEAERCIDSGMKGVGELMPNGQGYSAGDETVMRGLMRWLATRHAPLLLHSTEPVGHEYHGKGTITPKEMYAFVKSYPDNALILAHWGGGLLFYELMPEVRDACARVYYDTAASLFLYQDRIFPLAASLAADRILWGTDFPLIEHQRFRRRVERAGLHEVALNGILGENAARLLGLLGRTHTRNLASSPPSLQR